MSEQPDDFRVLYVAGFSRCGSTLLGSLLGQLDGYFNLGEARMIWQRSLIDDRDCGCGVNFSACAVWRPIIERFEKEHLGVSAAEMSRKVARLARTRTLAITSRSQTARRSAVADAAPLGESVRRLYQSVQAVTGARVLVDTSKVPMYGYLLRQAGLDLRVVHLVRDPRAVARSRMVPKKHVDTQGTMGGVSILNTAVTWNLVNNSIERLLSESDYLRLGYHQLIEDPVSSLERLTRLMGQDTTPGPWLTQTSARIEPTHSVYGNPGRFTSGVVGLSVDQRWESMPAWRLSTVGALTYPTRLRYRKVLS